MRVRGWVVAMVVAGALSGCGDDGGGAGSTEAPTGRPSNTETSTPPTPSTTQADLGPEADSLVAGAVDPASLGPPYLGALTFESPRNCAVPVEESISRDGETVARLRYQLTFVDVDNRVVISFDEMEPLELEGVPVPPEQRRVASAFVQMPSLVVEPTGRFVEVGDMEEVVAAIVVADPSAAGVVDGPEFAEVMATIVQQRYWYTWFGLWIEWGRFDEPLEEGALLLDGGSEAPMTMSSLGTTPDGLTVLRQELTRSGDASALGIADQLRGLSVTDMGSLDGTAATSVEVVTEPHTLRPHSVHASSDVSLQTPDGEMRRLEERLYLIGWASGTC